MSGSAKRALIAIGFFAFVAQSALLFSVDPKTSPGKPAQMAANCQSIPLPEMHEDSPQMEPCMRANAWKLFTSQLVDRTGEPLWGEWCFVLNDTPRRLLCSNQSGNDFQLFSDVTKTEVTRLTMHFGLLLSMGEPRQLIGVTSSSSSAVETAGRVKDPFRARPKGLPSGGRVFAAAMVVYSPASVPYISDCFNGVTDSTLPGFNRITLGDLNAKCTEQSFSDSLTKVQSIALKTVWAVVTDDGAPPHQGPRLSTTVPVWVNPDPDDRSTTQMQSGIPPLDPTGGFWSAPDLDSWSTYVKLALDGSACPANEDFRPSAGGTTVIPLNCFYNFPVTFEEYNRFLHWANIRSQIASPHTAGKMYFVLLGIHVTKKEIPNWTWQTFWWNWKTGSDDQSPYQVGSSAQGAINDGRWSHYTARVTYGPPASNPTSYSPQPVFNPYLEAPLPNGMKSNCFACHQYAILRQAQATDLFFRSQRIALGTCDLAAGAGLNGCLVDHAQTASFMTDFLYSLADTNAFAPSNAALSQRSFSPKIDQLTRLFAQRLRAKVIQTK